MTIDYITVCKCSFLVFQLAEQAGVPPGVFNVITSSRANASPIGKELCENPLVAKISFTGSSAVGKVSGS